MKKIILKLDVHDDRDKRKALKTVSSLSGIDSITMNMKDRTLTVVGIVDPISVVSRLRKLWQTDILLVGPAKEPEKKEGPKKEEGKKDEAKKDESKKEDGKKEEAPKEEQKKKEEGKDEDQKKRVPPQLAAGMLMPPYRPYYPPPQQAAGMVMPYRPYYPPVNTYYNHQYQPHHSSIEENPNACVIC